MQFFHRYQALSERFPRLVNGLTGFVIAGAGDYACQKYFEHPQVVAKSQVVTSFPSSSSAIAAIPPIQGDGVVTAPPSVDAIAFEWNAKRTMDMSLIRAFVITPFVLKWYPTLVYLCPGASIPRVIGRVLIDQAIGSPLCIFLVFLSNSFLLGESIEEFEKKVQHQFYPTWLAGSKYWPFVHCINFGFVPLRNQPLFAHFASVYWNAVLSYYSNKKEDI